MKCGLYTAIDDPVAWASISRLVCLFSRSDSSYSFARWVPSRCGHYCITVDPKKRLRWKRKTKLTCRQYRRASGQYFSTATNWKQLSLNVLATVVYGSRGSSYSHSMLPLVTPGLSPECNSKPNKFSQKSETVSCMVLVTVAHSITGSLGLTTKTKIHRSYSP